MLNPDWNKDDDIFQEIPQACKSQKPILKNRNNPSLIQADSNKNIVKYNRPKPPVKKGSLSPRQIIDKIFKNKEEMSDDVSSDLAEALTLLSVDLYAEPERFIFELLQNADDFPGESAAVTIQFILLEQHLLILHNGLPFGEKEVKAISKIGGSTKINNAATTGYKGIGFKSVFAHSDCVYICSGDYSFKYDSHYNNSPIKTPWQMKPIWVEECDFPEEIKPYLIPTQWSVAIALRMENTKINDYKNRIKKLFSEPRFILFLRNVNSIKVLGLGEDSDINLKLDRSSKPSKISNNKDINDSWLVKDLEVDVSEEMREKIEKNQQISKKLKSATKTKLSFAIKIKDHKLIPLKESVLFTYLPTNVKDFKFPFLVNADFITTSNREDLHRDNDWNIFIFEKLAYGFFKFLEQLCTDEKPYRSIDEEPYPYRNFIADLIPDRLSLDLHGELAKFFNIGFDKGLQEIAFIPPKEGKDLLKVSEGILDETGITKVIEVKTIKSALGIDKCFISNSLKNPNKFKDIGVEIFDFNKLVQFLKIYLTPLSPSNEYQKVLRYLQKMGYGDKLRESEIPTIWDENKNLIAATSNCLIYFQPSDEDKALLTFDNFKFIHPDIDEICKNEPDIYSYLKSLGVEEFKPIEIIRDRLKSLNTPSFNTFELFSNTNSINDTNVASNDIINEINYLRFIFKYRNELTGGDRQKLANLNILYKRSDKYYLAKASDCYLSDYYKPERPLESIAQELGESKYKFIASDYCEEDRSISDWREFLIGINTIKPDGLELLRNLLTKIEAVKPENALEIAKGFFNYRKDLTPDNFDRLSNLPILLKNGELALAKECYLANKYDPKQKLENLFAGTSFNNIVSDRYIDRNTTRSSEEWKEFFIKIQLKEEMRIEYLSKKEILSSESEVKKKFQEFENFQFSIYLQKHGLPPLSCSSEKYLVMPDLIGSDLTNDYLIKIWEYLSNNWDRLNIGRNNINSDSFSFFKFIPSIPCLDNKCRRPSEIYSNSLKSSLEGSELPISTIKLPNDIEKFLGLKRDLDVEACLNILNQISTSRHLDRLNSVYQKLGRICHSKLSDSDRNLIRNWSKTGELLASDDSLCPISQLYYIHPTFGFSHIRNSQIVKSPEREQEYFESLLKILGVTSINISDIEIKKNYDFDPILREVIKQRVKYISIYLINSTNSELVTVKEKEILQLLETITFYNPSEISRAIKVIAGVKEPIPNYYYPEHPKSIYYVGAWNSRKNAKIGEYLIKALELESKITSERLLDFLDDPIHEVRQYLVDSGFDIPELPLISDNQYNSHEIRSLTPFVETPSQGIGINPEHWGRWGEDIAKTFYEEHSYTVKKQADIQGYDFLCSRSNDELFVEVKTISSSNDVIRITRNEWDNMCKSENQEKYELFIVVHKGKYKEKTIRVKSAWKTLVQVLLKINNHPLTPCEYNSDNIESLLGFQRNSNGNSNDMIFNWKRLLEESHNPNIEIISY